MKLSGWLGKTNKVVWATFLLALPVTSFPYFPGFMGKSVMVRPLALYPLSLLLVLAILPRLIKLSLPRTLIPFAVFTLVASISTVYAFTRGIHPSIDVSIYARALRTIITLVLGGLIYFTVSVFPQNQADLKFTLTWIYVGCAISLLWASFQIFYVVHFDRGYFNALSEIQSFMSIRKLFDKRISGMTYEPSWFAEQLTFVLMPLLFASVVSNTSVFGWRYRRLTVEMILLGWSVLGVLFTYSRTGLGIFVILLTLSLLIASRQNRRQGDKRWGQIFRLILLVGLVLLVLVVVVYAVAQKNNYFSRLWTYWTDEESEGTYFYYIAFDQRFVYWETAYQIFEDHPVLGIGLGNFAFYFDEYLPDRQYRNPELLSKLVPEEGGNQIVTVKNYLLRILSETGILGFSAFVAFLIALAGCVLSLLYSADRDAKFWGNAGLLGLVAFLPVTLSVDSFAIPNMWVVFGLITASAHIFNRNMS